MVIDIGALGYEFCLSDEMIKDLKVNHIQADKVVTVENLTSFYDFNLQNSFSTLSEHESGELQSKIYLKLFTCWHLKGLHLLIS